MTDITAIRERDAEAYLAPLSRDVHGNLWDQARYDRRALLQFVDRIVEAEGRVTCKRCDNHPEGMRRSLAEVPGYSYTPCPDCTPLRALIEEAKR